MNGLIFVLIVLVSCLLSFVAADATVIYNHVEPTSEPFSYFDDENRPHRNGTIMIGDDMWTSDIVYVTFMANEPQHVFNRMIENPNNNNNNILLAEDDEGRIFTLQRTIVPADNNDSITIYTGSYTDANGYIYQICTKLLNGVLEHVVVQMHNDFFFAENDIVIPPPELTDTPVSNSSFGFVTNTNFTTRSRKLVDDGSVQDILIVVSRGAMCNAAGWGSGGTCAMTASNQAPILGLVDLAISETNLAFLTSGINTILNLAHVHFDDTFNDYGVGGDWSGTLGTLGQPNDGILDYVHDLRDQYYADFVSFWVDISQYCGIGYRPDNPRAQTAFSMVQWDCATGYYSFGHELAHNMVKLSTFFFIFVCHFFCLVLLTPLFPFLYYLLGL